MSADAAIRKLQALVDYLATCTKSPGDHCLQSEDFTYGYKMGVHDHNMAVVERIRNILNDEEVTDLDIINSCDDDGIVRKALDVANRRICGDHSTGSAT